MSFKCHYFGVLGRLNNKKDVVDIKCAFSLNYSQ